MIEIKTFGINRTLRIIDNVGDAVGDNREFLREEAVPFIQREVRRIFRSRGYGRWAPLSPTTIRRKGHARPLIRSRRYFREATQTPTLRITKDSLRYGVDVPYADYHEAGTLRVPAS